MKKVCLEVCPNSECGNAYVHPDYTEAALRIIERQPFVDSAHWYERGAKTRIFIEWSKLYDESDVAGLREKLEKLVASDPEPDKPTPLGKSHCIWQ
jgi:hypothetical protein